MSSSRQRGQSSVELVAVIPALVIACLLVWQLAAAAHAWLSAAGAARAAARAAAVGAPPHEAARATLPPTLARTARTESDGSRVRVRVSVPRLLPFVVGFGALPLEASAPVGRVGP